MASHKVFIDSSVLYAFVDRADPNHLQAAKIIENFSLQNFLLYTSYQSIQDAYAAINHQLGSVLGFDFLQAIFESSIEILYPQKADLISAFRLMKANREKQISLKESIISVMMQKKGVAQIFTFVYWHNMLGTQSYSPRL